MKSLVYKCFAVLSILGVLLLAACGAKSKTVTIGIVSLSATMDPAVVGFKTSLAELGYVEGENVTYVQEGLGGNLDGLDAAFDHVMGAKPDLICTVGTPPTTKAKQVTEDAGTPVVFTVVTDPVASGFVASLTRPGGNLTGVRTGGSIAKQLSWLVSIAPGTKRVYMPHNPDDGGSVQSMVEVSAAAPGLGIEPVVVEVRTQDELGAALQNIPDDVDALFLLGSGFLNTQLDEYVAVAIEHKLPLASVCPCVDRGVLMSYGHDYDRDGQQAGRLAEQILQGTPPGDLPVETADFFLGLNLQTAQAIGLDIPNDILQQANTIIR